MNHLAHFLLCPPGDDMRAGTLIADFARGNDLGAFTPDVELGIRLHRRVDALVDQSPLVTGLKPLVDKGLRRYAGILLDVFFDYALIREWRHFGPATRSVFNTSVYGSLMRSEAAMPEPVRLVSSRMRGHDALSSCTTHDGCAHTLSRIATRLKRPVDLAAGVETLVRHEAEIVDTFAELLPLLQAQASSYFDGSNRSRRPLELSVSR